MYPVIKLLIPLFHSCIRYFLPHVPRSPRVVYSATRCVPFSAQCFGFWADFFWPTIVDHHFRGALKAPR